MSTGEEPRFEILEEVSHLEPKGDSPDGDLDSLEKRVEAVSVDDPPAPTTEGSVKTESKETTKDIASDAASGTESSVELAKKASMLKQTGNEHFKEGRFLEAMEFYTDAIQTCPEEEDMNYNRAVFYSNRSACLNKLGRPDEAIEDCTKAIELSPTYIKAYMRRAQAFEDSDKPEEALKDVNKVLEMDKTVIPAQQAQVRLTKIVKEREEKLKAEMMEKLKGFGNTILGKFGMSTDNFNMVQNPETGSYNIQYNPNPTK